MNKETGSIPRHQRGPRFAVALAWVLYVGFIGPFLISAPSTVLVVLGIALLLPLCIATYRVSFRSIPTEDSRR